MSNRNNYYGNKKKSYYTPQYNKQNTQKYEPKPTLVKEPEKEKPIEKENEPEQTLNFDSMNLKENLLRGIYGYGFEHPSRIQSVAIMPMLTKKDIVAQSQAGTGKTGAFTIGTMNIIDETINEPQAIIMSNTRELADQINSVICELGKYMGIKTSLSMGGIELSENLKSLKNAHIVVGTPGRIQDLIVNKKLNSDKIKILILDEADELLRDDFREQTRYIIESLPKTTQICIFSATLPAETLELTKQFMNDPIHLLIKKEELNLNTVIQYYINIYHENEKLATIRDLYSRFDINQCIIYVNGVEKAEWLKQELEKEDHRAYVIHGKLKNVERIEIMKKFRKAEFRVLISTDLTGRGIDVQQVSYVINFDLPHDPITYIHRIGRSGRYGKKGVAINFATKRDIQIINKLERYYNIKIEEMPEPEVINHYISGA